MKIEELPTPGASSRFRRVLLGPLRTLIHPILCRWARHRENSRFENGRPLTTLECQWASKAGVENPGTIRIIEESPVTMPLPTSLLNLFQEAGLPVFFPAGLSLGKSIFLDKEYVIPPVIIHELRHAAQYECLGGIAPFLHRYISECFLFGYRNAPLEKDARAMTASLLGHLEFRG